MDMNTDKSYNNCWLILVDYIFARLWFAIENYCWANRSRKKKLTAQLKFIAEYFNYLF